MPEYWLHHGFISHLVEWLLLNGEDGFVCQMRNEFIYLLNFQTKMLIVVFICLFSILKEMLCFSAMA